MSITTSVLEDLLQSLPQLRSHTYFKSSLTALSHAMEDMVLAGDDAPLVIANFQRERFYRLETRRYLRIAKVSPQVYVLAAPETDFSNRSGAYETIAFDPNDALSQEWHLVILSRRYGTCLVCRERLAPAQENRWLGRLSPDLDSSRRFEGVWMFDRQVSVRVANLLFDRILTYRPELADKIDRARTTYDIRLSEKSDPASETSVGVDPGPFAERLVTYLQAGQYKLLKAYRSLSEQERKERLVNSIASAIRASLDPEQVLDVATEELGVALEVCRCSIYRCKAGDDTARIEREYLADGVSSIVGQTWPLKNNPLFQTAVAEGKRVAIDNTQNPQTREEREYSGNKCFQTLVERWEIGAWLLVPVIYRGKLLGAIELHKCRSHSHPWRNDELALVDAIATQIGVALIQAETHANLEELNQQLEALERTRSNLIAITGHELRTPLSTIQVCLESLASEPDMPIEVQQVMLDTALADTERLRELVRDFLTLSNLESGRVEWHSEPLMLQECVDLALADTERLRELVRDFLTLSNLESGRVEWHSEPLMLQECVDLALSSIRARGTDKNVPQILTEVPPDLPLVQADGEWLVQVLGKLLDNACKFTPAQGEAIVKARRNGGRMLEVTVADTGRGIEPDRLEAIFERFYQEEGALRRTTGGTGLGLAICRQIIQRWGGRVWANSDGKDKGSEFHFTVPIFDSEQ